MGKSITLLGCASLLALGCGDDSGLTPTDESSSGLVEPSTSTGPVGPSTSTGPADSTSTTEPGTTTDAVDSSSTGPTEVCGNDVIDGDDVCDGSDLGAEDCVSQNFDAGTLGCASDCSEYDTSECQNFNCGNNSTEGKEACDGTDLGGATCQTLGYDNGTLSCAMNCGAIDVSDCGTCGNVIVDGDEVCDDIVLFGQTCESQGFSSGQLGCADDCLTYDTASCIMCGNDLIDGIEPCDGVDLGGADCVSEGYVGGVLACDADCGAFDISACNTCGNELIEPGEGCDGMNLNGASCASLGLIGGTLSCGPNCQYDFSACDIPGMQFGSDTGYNGFVIQGLPMLPCDNILATGTPTLLTDDSNIVVPIGFTFPLYGVNYSDANIQSNGVLRFGDASYLSFTNSCIPTPTNPSVNNLYVFWDDLNPTTGGDVYYQTLGAVGSRRFVVQWELSHHLGSAVDLINVQAMLYEATGQIDVCYVDTLSAANVGDNGAEATAGIQQNSGNGFDYSCNTPDLTNGTLLRYIPL